MRRLANNGVTAWEEHGDPGLDGRVREAWEALAGTLDRTADDFAGAPEALADWRRARLAAVGQMRDLVAALAVEAARDALTDDRSGISQREVARRLKISPSAPRLWLNQMDEG